MLLPIRPFSLTDFCRHPYPVAYPIDVRARGRQPIVVILLSQQPTGKASELLPRRVCLNMPPMSEVEPILPVVVHIYISRRILGCLASTLDLRCCADG